jgi:chemotaxis protein histidine kinase CheA
LELDRADYLGVFLEEAKATADAVDRALEQLRSGYDRRAVNAALIPLERLNGAAGVLDMGPVASLTKVMGQAFSLVRRRQRPPDEVMGELLAVGAGRLRSIVADLETTGTTEQSVQELCESMERAGEPRQEAPSPEALETIKQECLEQVERRTNLDRLGDGPSVLTLGEDLPHPLSGELAWGKMRVVELRVKFEAALMFKETRAYQLLRNLAAIGTVLASVPEWNEMSDGHEEIRVLLVTDETDATIAASAHSIAGIREVEILAVRGHEAELMEDGEDVVGAEMAQPNPALPVTPSDAVISEPPLEEEGHPGSNDSEVAELKAVLRETVRSMDRLTAAIERLQALLETLSIGEGGERAEPPSGP